MHKALIWLKEHNPIYQDIIISVKRLADFPVDDVLCEIVALAKHSDDVAHLSEEQDGYVPDNDCDTFGEHFIVFY